MPTDVSAGRPHPMERSASLGLLAGLGLIAAAVLLGDGAVMFLDAPALLLVGGGTLAALFVGYPVALLRRAPALVRGVLAFRTPDLRTRGAELLALARLARSEGRVALDHRLTTVADPLTRFGLEMAVDGLDPEELDDRLQTRMDAALTERRQFASLCATAGAYTPAFGMIGTLVGLVQMLQHLAQPSELGPAMAVAFLSTLYGAVLANAVFLPLAARQRAQVAVLARAQELARAGVLGIALGEGPTAFQRRLAAHLDAPVPTAQAPRPVRLRRAA